jgi:hypothetical protein
MMSYIFDSEGKYMILKGRSKGMYKVYHKLNEYYFVSLEYNCCFCREFEQNKHCEHLELVKKMII